jgi:hypothetical protein
MNFIVGEAGSGYDYIGLESLASELGLCAVGQRDIDNHADSAVGQARRYRVHCRADDRGLRRRRERGEGLYHRNAELTMVRDP